MRSAPLLVVLAVVVLSGSAALRLTGLDWLLPSLVEQDAHIPVQVRLMENPTKEPEKVVDWGAYPHLVARLAQLLTPTQDWAPPAADVELATLLDRARWPVLRVRLIVALLSMLAVLATYRLARLWLTPHWSWLAAALMGTSLLAVHFGGQARAHGAATGLMALAVLACVRMRRRADAASYALAGLGVGAAVGCLQSGLATLFPLAVAHLGVAREHGRRRHVFLLLPLACVGLSVLAFWPFVFEPTPVKQAGHFMLDGGVLEQAKHRVLLHQLNGLGFVLLWRHVRDWEPALAWGAFCAALVWLATLRQPTALKAASSDRLIVLSFVLAYAVAVGLYQRSYERFLLPLIPYFAVFSTWGAARICEAVRATAARRVLAGLLAVGLLAFPTLVAVRLVNLRLVPTTLDLTADWIKAHVEPPGPRIVMGMSFTVPLPRTPISEFADAKLRPDNGLGWLTYQKVALLYQPVAPAWHMPWIPYTGDMADLHASLKRGLRTWVSELPGELCVNEVYLIAHGATELSAFTTALRAYSERLATISPDIEPLKYEVPLAYQNEPTGPLAPMAWRVLHAQRFGPVIEIYRLPQAGQSAETR